MFVSMCTSCIIDLLFIYLSTYFVFFFQKIRLNIGQHVYVDFIKYEIRFRAADIKEILREFQVVRVSLYIYTDVL